MILRLFAIIFLVASLVTGWAVMDYNAFVSQPIVTKQPVVIDINKGSSFQSRRKRQERIFYLCSSPLKMQGLQQQ